jgi:hypothetical protein
MMLAECVGGSMVRVWYLLPGLPSSWLTGFGLSVLDWHARVSSVSLQLAEGVKYLHETCLAHRRLQPSTGAANCCRWRQA